MRPTLPCRRLSLRWYVWTGLCSSGVWPIVVVRYRRGSTAVLCRFFDELSAVLDHVCRTHCGLLTWGLLTVHQIHQLGWTLDAVITHHATGHPNCVSVEDVSLSDHFLLWWEVDFTLTLPSTADICSRPWRQLDLVVPVSAVCVVAQSAEEWPAGVDDMVTAEQFCMERAARLCHISQFVVGFPAATETHTVPPVIPRHYYMTLKTPIVVLAMALSLRPL